MKKVLAFLLACLLLLPTLMACGNEKAPADTTASAVVTTEATTTADPNAPELPTPEEIGDISGDFHILVAGNWEWNDFQSEGEDSSVVDSAIYRRNAYMSEKYNVNITNEDVVAYSSSMGTGTGYVKIYREYMAGESTYDAAMVGTYDVATLAYNGYLADLNSIEYLDLSKPYWDQKANEDLSMNGKMFYTTGDISVADNRATYVLFFSKSMLKNYNLEDPYELVRENKWTLEKFGTMVKSVGEDVDQNGVYDKNDVFGLLTPTDTHLAILSAAQERVCTINDDGQIGLTFYSERIVNLYDKYLEIVGDHSHTYNYQYNYMTGATGLTSTNEERIAMFNSDKALFYSHTMFYMDHLRDLDNDFGILPYPKYDETQNSYGNLVSAWHSQFLCVPAMVQDQARTGIILEELAYYGKEVLTPAYYEKTLVGQYTRDEESAEMLDIIFSNLVYDVGIYYNIGTYKDQLAAMVRTGKSLTTIYETYKRTADAKIEKINNFFQQNTAN
ncbi:MAG: extracellular solute-binding protein [Clostridia bacterium]|nr:extracellular solute-binding protein [Clostridia bacterium]